MYSYHLIFYFSDKINFETTVDSDLEINEFVVDFNKKIQQANMKYINFLGNPIITINMDNVLFYKIEETNKTIKTTSLYADGVKVEEIVENE